jgi:hypothetical protein
MNLIFAIQTNEEAESYSKLLENYKKKEAFAVRRSD